jgi:hypothetical protein
MKYKPYDMEPFKKLVQWAYMLGNYGGKRCLFNLKCVGEFEGFSGRASECWEQRFTLTVDSREYMGRSIGEVCEQALGSLAKNEATKEGR